MLLLAWACWLKIWLYNPVLEPIEKLPTTFSFYDKAASYYRQAGAMPDLDGSLTPARALGSLAGLYDAGIPGVRNLENYPAFSLYMETAADEVKANPNSYKKYAVRMMHRAHILQSVDFATLRDLYQESAEAGWAESQINLAIVLYRGEGVDADPQAAYDWVTKAWENKDQLPAALHEQVFHMQEFIAYKLGMPAHGLQRPAGPGSTGSASSKPNRPG